MHRWAIIVFPLILVPWEAGVRTMLSLPAWEFVGPTLCVAGLSLLVSLTKVRKIKVTHDGMEITAVREGDYQFLVALLLIVILFLLAWAGAYFLAQPSNAQTALIPAHSLVGICVYTVSCVCYAIRDAHGP